MATDPNCIFCKIVRGEIPAKLIVRTDMYLAFYDVTPQAPFHALVIPVQHIPAVSRHADGAALGELVAAAARIGAESGPGGFRLIVNEGPDGGQTVDHLHVHILAGRQLRWPPG